MMLFAEDNVGAAGTVVQRLVLAGVLGTIAPAISFAEKVNFGARRCLGRLLRRTLGQSELRKDGVDSGIEVIDMCDLAIRMLSIIMQIGVGSPRRHEKPDVEIVVVAVSAQAAVLKAQTVPKIEPTLVKVVDYLDTRRVNVVRDYFTIISRFATPLLPQYTIRRRKVRE